MIRTTKRSGGPKTETGRLAASKNAIKTGAYSSMIVLPGELESDFKQLEEQFVKDFAPQDIAESAMVRELAILTRKKLRLERLAHTKLIQAMARPFSEQELRSARCPKFIQENVSWLNTPDQFTVDYAANYQSNLEHAKRLENETKFTPDEFFSLRDTAPFVYEYIISIAEKYGFDTEPENLGDLADATLDLKVGGTIPLIAHAAECFSEVANKQLLACEYQDEILRVVRSIHEERLPPLMHDIGTQRAHDDLSRGFFRTLSELRRHHQWRRDESAIVVSPEPKELDSKKASSGSPPDPLQV